MYKVSLYCVIKYLKSNKNNQIASESTYNYFLSKKVVNLTLSFFDIFSFRIPQFMCKLIAREFIIAFHVIRFKVGCQTKYSFYIDGQKIKFHLKDKFCCYQ